MDYRHKQAVGHLAVSLQDAARTIETVLTWDDAAAAEGHILGAARIAHANTVAIEQLVLDTTASETEYAGEGQTVPLGTATLELDADTSKLDSAVADAEARVRQSVAKMEELLDGLHARVETSLRASNGRAALDELTDAIIRAAQCGLGTEARGFAEARACLADQPQ